MSELKKCTKCKEEFPIRMFYVNNSSNDGRDWRCKGCIKQMRFGYQPPDNPVASNIEVVLETRDMTNKELFTHIRSKLADEIGKREAKEHIEKLHPKAFEIDAEAFLKSRLFNKDVKYGSDWY